jgi:glutathione peroxidase
LLIYGAPGFVRIRVSSIQLIWIVMQKFMMWMMLILSPITTLAEEPLKQTAYSFEFTSIEGQPLPMKNFKGKTVLLVNTASRCAFTRQYDDLQSVWERYRDLGLVVLGVPSNDFGNQEPGTESQIKSFCEVNFDVNFPMTSKASLKGKDTHPFYRWAAQQFGLSAKPRWNFHKYLISPDGQLVDWFSTPTSPTSKRVLRAIEAQLTKTTGKAS